jgi:hypothetical protein
MLTSRSTHGFDVPIDANLSEAFDRVGVGPCIWVHKVHRVVNPVMGVLHLREHAIVRQRVLLIAPLTHVGSEHV